jgi:predicted  nucleic acid-binding Zn-ribbon protein
MSDSQAYEEVTISSEGVTVTKRFEADEFPVPAIAFEFASNRDEEVHVRLTDPVPENIEVEDLGFHPEYGSEYWTIDDDTITFERSLAPQASYTTVYGIRATGSDNIQQFLAEPTLEEVDPPLPDDRAVVPDSGDDVVKNAIAGDGEIPGLGEDDEEEEDDEEDVATLDLKDPSEPGDRGTDTGGADAGETTDGATPVSIEGGSLVAAMAAELRQQNVSAEDVKLLRQAFEIAAQEGGSTAAKIEQIQSDIADLRAYTGSLEEFLDENGTAQEMLDSFEQRVDSFDSRLEEFESNIQANSRQLSSIDDDLGSVSEEVDSMGEEMSSIGEEVDSMGEEMSSIDEEVDSMGEEMSSIGEEVDSVAGDVEELDEEVSSIGDEVSAFGEDMADLEATIGDIERTVADLEEEVTDGDVAERIEEIEGSVNDLKQWQEQIKQTFGG